MRKYFFYIVIMSIVAIVIGILSFLIGNETGAPSIATAAASGAFSGVAMAFAHEFGRNDAGASFDGKKLAVTIIAGLLGCFGGIMMGL